MTKIWLIDIFTQDIIFNGYPVEELVVGELLQSQNTPQIFFVDRALLDFSDTQTYLTQFNEIQQYCVYTIMLVEQSKASEFTFDVAFLKRFVRFAANYNLLRNTFVVYPRGLASTLGRSVSSLNGHSY